ncbi:MAG: bacterioferritin [Gammaproteobacteria bacterium]|jgi:bacterioferritin|nr:bacterioferritin [Gammaproteobacteria bacterium]
MLYANADQRVLGYLGRALSLELSAVQLYSTQARLVATWGLTEAAERLSSEATEEMGHVDRIIGRMLALGVAPNASQLRPVQLGRSLPELLRHDHAFENELVKLYEDATRHCARAGDHDNRLFFETLLGEEKAHSHELVQWLEQLERPGGTATSTQNMPRATF